MTNKEAVERIKDHVRVHKIGEYPHVHLAEALNLAITALESPRYDWTPCAEGLPVPDAEENGVRKRYICTTSTPSGKFVVVELIYITVGEKPVWYDNDYYELFEGSGYQVIAWMPRPEPYNPDQFREPTEMMQEDEIGPRGRMRKPLKPCCGEQPLLQYTESAIGLSPAYYTIKCRKCHGGVEVDVTDTSDAGDAAAMHHAVDLWNVTYQHKPPMKTEICLPRTEEVE